ncbi:hypothetical protein ILUMI_26790 [Ignelater luminosus]|uniref:Uncharacterized protein n=1 Tax=Ignelater luminosus TaxID=2038154 RepID=A0A8K0C5X7_IGNLU|nr:hypothetical protein ILUMI_26790 [Ignelater luminosus]
MPGFSSLDSQGLKLVLNYKLPKMRFRQSGGGDKRLASFWDQFQKILNEEKMDSSDKLHYFLMSITPNSVAEEVVEKFPDISEIYDNVIKALKGRFGREDLLTKFYVRELLKHLVELVLSKENDFIRTDKIQSHLRHLRSLRVTVDNCIRTYAFGLLLSSRRNIENLGDK